MHHAVYSDCGGCRGIGEVLDDGIDDGPCQQSSAFVPGKGYIDDVHAARGNVGIEASDKAPGFEVSFDVRDASARAEAREHARRAKALDGVDGAWVSVTLAGEKSPVKIEEGGFDGAPINDELRGADLLLAHVLPF